MSELQLKDRQFVVPGQFIGENISCEGACRREGTDSFSSVKGVVRFNDNKPSIIPLNGPYTPKPGDVVVGVVDNDFGGVYSVDIDGPFRCILRPDTRGGGRGGDRGQRGGRGGRDRRDYRDRGPREHEMEPEPTEFKVGNIISAKIASVDESKEAQLMGPRILESGYVLKVKPARVPRIIGKKKSMIDQIRQLTGSRISVGQNGLVWIKDGNVALAIEAIRKVEKEAYTSGLTNRMQEFLQSRKNSG